jgi:hypothetical protein
MEAPAPLRVELRPSRLAGAFIAVTHLATALLVAWLAGNAAARAAIVIAIGVHALWALRASSLRNLQSSIVAAELRVDRRITLFRRDGGRVEACVRADAYVGERLVTLVVRRSGSRRSCALWLLPDMAAPDELRAFRVLLRMGREGEARRH